MPWHTSMMCRVFNYVRAVHVAQYFVNNRTYKLDKQGKAIMIILIGVSLYLGLSSLSCYYALKGIPPLLLQHGLDHNKWILFIISSFFLLGNFWTLFNIYVFIKTQVMDINEYERLAKIIRANDKRSNSYILKICNLIAKNKCSYSYILHTFNHLDYKDSWFHFLGYQILVEGNIIKIKDENMNIRGYVSFKEFRDKFAN